MIRWLAIWAAAIGLGGAMGAVGTCVWAGPIPPPVQRGTPFPLAQLFSPPVQTPHPAVVRVVVHERGGMSLGSGVLVAVQGDYGLVLTNWHVVRDAAGPISVVFPDGFRSGATILKADSEWDLAALAIWRPLVEPIPLAADMPRLGEPLTIVGYGNGQYRAATGRCLQYLSPARNAPPEMIELSVAARQGDSGGPILNSRGELAGVLFGASWGRTAGSSCRRVRTFLASLSPWFGTDAAALAGAHPPPASWPTSNPQSGPATYWASGQISNGPSSQMLNGPAAHIPSEPSEPIPKGLPGQTPNWSYNQIYHWPYDQMSPWSSGQNPGQAPSGAPDLSWSLSRSSGQNPGQTASGPTGMEVAEVRSSGGTGWLPAARPTPSSNTDRSGSALMPPWELSGNGHPSTTQRVHAMQSAGFPQAGGSNGLPPAAIPWGGSPPGRAPQVWAGSTRTSPPTPTGVLPPLTSQNPAGAWTSSWPGTSPPAALPSSSGTMGPLAGSGQSTSRFEAIKNFLAFVGAVALLLLAVRIVIAVTSE